MGQWLGLCTFMAQGLGSIPDQVVKTLKAIWRGKRSKHLHTYSLVFSRDQKLAVGFCHQSVGGAKLLLEAHFPRRGSFCQLFPTSRASCLMFPPRCPFLHLQRPQVVPSNLCWNQPTCIIQDNLPLPRSRIESHLQSPTCRLG